MSQTKGIGASVEPGTAKVDARQEAVAALKLLAAGVGGDATGAGEAIRSELTALVLRAAFAINAERRGLVVGDPTLNELLVALDSLAGDARDAIEAWLTRAGVSAPISCAIDAHVAHEAILRIAAAVGSPGGDGPIEDLGRLYEGLVDVGIGVTVGPSVAVRPDGSLVDLAALLATAPDCRAESLASIGCALPPRSAEALGRATSIDEARTAIEKRVVPAWPGAPAIVPAGVHVVVPTSGRRQSGSHYTPPILTADVVRAALDPLLGEAPSPEMILALRVCDPSMGSGAFLLEVCRYLAYRLRAARGGTVTEARREIAERCLYGVDCEPFAVDLARMSLWLCTHDRPESGAAPARFLERTLRCGDSLIGAPMRQLENGISTRRDTFDWPIAFPEVFENDGFDAIVGNPPWISYAGRAAQPLDPELHRYYQRENPAFFGYRTLHGLFIYRSAALLRPGGRLGLVVPTSVADLSGYEPTRLAHDRLCVPDPALPDFDSDAFEGVFQPSMALLSTRLVEERSPTRGAIWEIARSGIAPTAQTLLDRLSSLRPLPAGLFGERGLQTMGGDEGAIRTLALPEPPFTVPIREGRDVGPFVARAPRLHLNHAAIGARLRSDDEWRRVALLIRQTARFPIVARADGIAFRNSILAGFEDNDYSASFLLAYLNSTPVRWFHFARNRDARQGMPQVKIGHLRAIPAPIDRDAAAELGKLGKAIVARSCGPTNDEIVKIDALSASALGIDEAGAAFLRAWAADNPAPRPIDEQKA